MSTLSILRNLKEIVANPTVRVGLESLPTYLKFLLEPIRKSAFHLVYPTKCLHCQILLPPESIVICEECASTLQLIDSEERCPACFCFLSDNDSLLCSECLRFPPLYARVGAAFDYEGPASTLVKKLKYGNQPYLAKGMAGFLVAQLYQLDWPIPDALIPVPQSLTHRLERGYNQSALLAEEMGRIIQRPVWNALQRKSGDFSQAALSLEGRNHLERNSFKLKYTTGLADKNLLIVDDVSTSGSTLRRCAEMLVSHGPASLYALTFCKTLLLPNAKIKVTF